jgi:hypothetical protein
MIQKITILIFTLSVFGCATIAPVNSPDFPKMVSKSIPKSDGEIRFHGTGTWYLNSRGFSALRLFSPQSANLEGVLVITTDAVLFEQWDDKTQELVIIKRLPFVELTSVALDSLGLGKRMVLRKKDLSFESFDFTKANGQIIDGTKTEEAVLFLGNQIKSSNGENS